MTRLLSLLAGLAAASALQQALATAWLAWQLSAFTCAPADDADECSALADLYASTNGPGWHRRAGWAAAAAGTGFLSAAECRLLAAAQLY